MSHTTQKTAESQENKDAVVFVVEDREEIAESIEWVLSSVGYSVKIYKQAEDFLSENFGKNFLKSLAKKQNSNIDFCNSRNSCLILDIRMPGMGGLKLQQLLKQNNIETPIIFISAYADVPTTVEIMKSGAINCLVKPINDQKLLDSVHEALLKDIKYKQQRQDKKNVLLKLNSLTAREKEVLNLVAHGDLNKIIADKLHINIKTVEAHRTHIKEKLGVRNTVQMVKIFYYYELILGRFAEP